MSKAHKADHKNPRTKQLLENREQVCPACYENFGTTEAGDAHRIGVPGVDRRCIRPDAANLIQTTNKFGTTIWRKNDGTKG